MVYFTKIGLSFPQIVISILFLSMTSSKGFEVNGEENLSSILVINLRKPEETTNKHLVVKLSPSPRKTLVEANIAWHQEELSKKEPTAWSLFKRASDLGDKEATLRMADIYSKSWEPNHNKESIRLNDLLVNQRYKKAIKRKIYGLNHGIFSYNMEPDEAKILLIEYVNREEKWALWMQLDGYDAGMYGFSKNPQLAGELLENIFALDKQYGLKVKAEALFRGCYGFNKNLEEAKKLIETHAKQDQLWALKRQIIGLTKNEYGFKKDLSKAREMNENLIKKDSKWAKNRKVQGLLEGRFGYEKNTEKAYRLARAWLVYDLESNEYTIN